MSRITYQSSNGAIKLCEFGGNLQRAIEALYSFESTGYTPEEITDIAARCNILDGHNKQLREIRDEYWKQIAALKVDNQGLRANSMIQEHIIQSGGNPLDKDKIFRLIMENTSLKADNERLRAELTSAKVEICDRCKPQLSENGIAQYCDCRQCYWRGSEESTCG